MKDMGTNGRNKKKLAEPSDRIELSTTRLQGGSSTTELQGRLPPGVSREGMSLDLLQAAAIIALMWARRDLNPHALRRQDLNLVRLPFRHLPVPKAYRRTGGSETKAPLFKDRHG